MKTKSKSVILALTVALLGMTTQTAATNKPESADSRLGRPKNTAPTRTFQMNHVETNCFAIPYTQKQLQREWDSIMAADIERLARENISYSTLKKEFLGAKFFVAEDAPSSVACFYHLDISIFHY